MTPTATYEYAGFLYRPRFTNLGEVYDMVPCEDQPIAASRQRNRRNAVESYRSQYEGWSVMFSDADAD